MAASASPANDAVPPSAAVPAVTVVAPTAVQQAYIDDLMPTDEDLLYEEELLRNPYSLKMWWRYIQARLTAPPKRRYLLWERALKVLPGSYKLWSAYLKERRLAVRGMRPDAAAVTALNNTYERALVSMHKMPRIWVEYLTMLVDQKLVTKARRTFDRALQALPITQHDRIWGLYLKFIGQPGLPVETAVRVYRRYLKLEPTHTEEFLAYLRAKEHWGEAARKLAEVLNDDSFRSLEGKTKHQMWLELCDVVTKHPKEVTGMRVDAIIRGGIRKFTDEVGRLWTSLADYYIRRGLFERARDVYEEGLQSVMTVRDFSLIFDALTQFEESLLTATLERLGDDADSAVEVSEETLGMAGGHDFLLTDDGNDIDLRLARLEHLMARRPELLSSVMLRQNPHNVHEWHKRVKLFEGNPTRQILTYTEAVKTVDADKALGKPHSLWCAFAKFYERHGDVVNARIIFDKAVQVTFKYVDDLASVWCEYAEMELRHQNFKRALELMRRATAEPSRATAKRPTREEERLLPVQARLYRSLKLWSFYADLEESLGTLESTQAVYDRVLELRIATPQIVLNYAMFLQEHKHFEDSFKVYERGVALFKYPHVRDIWAAYLQNFVDRYGGKKLERARDLFEHALGMAPAEEARPLFLDYARLEEQHGLAKHAMEVYDRAVKGVPKAERMKVVELYVSKASEFFGVGKVREIYETVIEAEAPHELPDADVRSLCLRYAALERQLGEVDRARSILVHASGMAHPRRDRTFWEEWKQFEVNHGNEDTFREMLRIQRSVAAAFSHQHMDMATAAVAEVASDPSQKRGREAGDTMATLEAEAEALVAAAANAAPATAKPLSGFVSAGVIQQSLPASALGGGAAAAANPDEIDLDAEDDAAAPSGADAEADEAAAPAPEGDAPDVHVGRKAVPAAVFGSLVAAVAEENAAAAEQEQLGALERFKKRKVQL